MAYKTYGGGPADIAADSSGNVKGGIEYKIWSKKTGGVQITDLRDRDGMSLAGKAVSLTDSDVDSTRDIGRIIVQAPESFATVVWAEGAPDENGHTGDRWPLYAEDVWASIAGALNAYTDATTAAQQAADNAAALSDNVDVLKSKIDSSLAYGFDITKIDPVYVQHLRPVSPNVMQSFQKDPATGQWYVTQHTSTGAPAGSDNVLLSRLTPDGSLIDSMILYGAGHGSTFGLETVGGDTYVWITWRQESDNTNVLNKIVRFKYVADTTLNREDTEALPTLDGATQNSYILCALDWANDRAAIRYNTSTQETWTLRKISEWRAGTDNVLATVGPLNVADNATFQAFATIDDDLYVSRGGTPNDNGVATLTRYDWQTGASAQVDIAPLAGNGDGTHMGTYNEVEGCAIWRGASGKASVMVGKVIGTVGQLVNTVYAWQPVGADDLVAPMLRHLDTRIQTGMEDITPSAPDTPTSYVVEFPHRFAKPPRVTLTPGTMVPGEQVKGVGWWDVTPTGFTIYLTRTNTTHTYVSWIAVA